MDDDHDKIIKMQTDIGYIKDSVKRIETNMTSNMECIRNDAKMAAVKYADEKVISTFRDVGNQKFAPKYLFWIITGIVLPVLGAYGLAIFTLATK